MTDQEAYDIVNMSDRWVWYLDQHEPPPPFIGVGQVVNTTQGNKFEVVEYYPEENKAILVKIEDHL